MRLYLITRRGNLGLDRLFEIILQAIRGGVTAVQLREKELAVHEYLEIGEALLSILRPLGVPLIINDSVEVAQAIGADGVHLGQSDLSVVQARIILGPQAIIGLSVENVNQIQEADKLDVNYVAASPVFVSKTKTDCQNFWGLDGLREVCKISCHPVIGIGGIGASNARQVFNAGAAGIAVASTIFDAQCPKSTAKELLS